MRHSVEAYNIHDGNGNVLYDGDIVMKTWGGGNDGRRYRAREFHKIAIGRKGRLTLSSCSNIVHPDELIKILPSDKTFNLVGLNKSYKDYF